MAILSILLDFLAKLFAKVFTDALQTPAKTTEVSTEEGNSPPLPASDYDDLYGLSDDRGEGKE